MSKPKTHTPGPWRWELNEKGKNIHLVGGVPQFDLTVMDFERWGMHGAAPRLRQVLHGGMSIMDRCDMYAKPVPGREHHSSWFQDVDHPDMRLIAASPLLLKALIAMVEEVSGCMVSSERQARAAIAIATGVQL